MIPKLYVCKYILCNYKKIHSWAMSKLWNHRDQKDHESKIKPWRQRQKVNYEGKNNRRWKNVKHYRTNQITMPDTM